jgi:hypothetical protein
LNLVLTGGGKLTAFACVGGDGERLMPYYVFGDLKVLTLAEIAHYAAHALRHRSGSFHLVRTEQAHPFDDVFGADGAATAA